MKIFLKLIVIVALFIPGLSDAKDLNGKGFELYKKGQFKKSHKTFNLAVKKTPRNVYAWYNLARTTYILNKKIEPEDVCNWQTWPFQVLGHLTKASEIDAKIVKGLLDRKEKNFDGFKKEKLFKKFYSALEHKLSGDLTKFDLEKKTFLKFVNEYPTDIMSDIKFLSDGKLIFNKFDGESEKKIVVGTYKIKKTFIEIATEDKKKIRLVAKASPMGPTNYYVFRLLPSGESKVPGVLKNGITLGPALGDCGRQMI